MRIPKPDGPFSTAGWPKNVPKPERGAVQHTRHGALDITIYFADVEGRWEPVATQILNRRLRPLTAVDMRSIPWQRVADKARPGPVVFGFTTGELLPDDSPVGGEHRVGFDRRRGGRRVKYGPEHFAEVARVYRQAYSRNRTPTRAVARHFGATPSAAAKWVAKCRELGMLPRTTRGKARVAPKKGRK